MFKINAISTVEYYPNNICHFVSECIDLEPVGNETSGQLMFDTRAYLDHIDKPINFDR